MEASSRHLEQQHSRASAEMKQSPTNFLSIAAKLQALCFAGTLTHRFRGLKRCPLHGLPVAAI